MTFNTIELTDDILKLISFIHFQEVPESPHDEDERQQINYAIDFNSLYGGTYVFEDIAMILGRFDERIEGTDEDPLGAQFPKEFEDYMWEIHTYIVDHIEEIEELVHQFCNRGGLTAGTYVSKYGTHVWKRKE